MTTDELLQRMIDDPDFLEQIRASGKLQKFVQIVDNYLGIQNAINSGNYNEAYRIAGNNPAPGNYHPLSPETEKYLDTEIARQNTAADNAFQEHMRDTSYTSAAQQLGQLGLSTSNVIQTGGANSGVTSAAAQNSHHSIASLRQQERINSYNQKMGIAKSLIGMAGSMASSGIYGASLNAAKRSAAVLSAATAHSGLSVLKHWNGYGNSGYEVDANGLLKI